MYVPVGSPGIITRWAGILPETSGTHREPDKLPDWVLVTAALAAS